MSKKNFKPQAGFPEIINASEYYKLENICKKWAEEIGASPILLPLVEQKELYNRSIGEGTDVVDKEMLSINNNKEELVLRPEGTAGAIRAWNNQGGRNIGAQKWYYSGYMFRNERPQAGRFKQFQQFGMEIIGSKEGIADIELLVDLDRLFERLNIRDYLTLKINNIGTIEERKSYEKYFIEWIIPFKDQLDKTSQERIIKNPLRILDSKDEATKNIILNAPKIIDFLSQESLEKWKKMITILEKMEISFEIDYSLMRGLDYYNGLVFEWVMTDENKAQNAVAAGGRYDGLSKSIDGEDTPALGFALGIERVLLLTKKETNNERKGIYICWAGDVEDLVLKVKKQMIQEDFVMVDEGFKNITKQIKKANEKMFSKLIVIGENEKNNKQIKIKNLSNGLEKSLKII